MKKLNIAILLPCLNEEGAIGNTITAFKHELPEAKIYVYDNNSTDNTAKEAKSAGAIVRREPRPGKGEVVRRMFSDVEADIYILADGDETYDSSCVRDLINVLITDQMDMVIGTRSTPTHAYPKGHILGNKAFSMLINTFFNANLCDVFSGYRVMSRRFVKTIPIISDGFQIETEMTVHALHHKLPILEVPTTYHPRKNGTNSKLKTFSDGFKILRFILFLIRDVKPLMFFTFLSILLALISLVLGLPIISEFLSTGLVPRLPTAVLASSVGLISIICLFTGLMLDNVTKGRMNLVCLNYKSYHPVDCKESNWSNHEKKQR
ncbi:glycosyltransferase family 2 protein [Vibrio diabolicus]|uniref:glycosyltransferase family 2 protein n=1 Tax=Vibrio diabolicus TaxID=50719 RepID=UPI002810165E|nr:glycosyltransferase [Vibrio diabolicus]